MQRVEYSVRSSWSQFTLMCFSALYTNFALPEALGRWQTN